MNVTRVIVDDEAPRSSSVSGYGGKIPTRYRLVCADNRTRRVYAMVYGNSGTLYMIVAGQDVVLTADIEMSIEVARDSANGSV